MVSFEWDLDKAAANARKHGVSFEEAMSIFTDPLSLTVSDLVHSGDEERFLTVGMSDRQRLIVVSYTDRHDVIRIISARRAAAREKREYEETS